MIPPVGPTARRKLIHSFRTFLGQEEDFFRVLLGRLAGNLLPPDWAGLRPLGVVVDQDDPQLVAAQVQRSEEEKKNDRSRSVPLAHKALICFGDLARYRELYNEAGSKKETVNGGGERERGKKGKKDASEKKQKNWKKAAECYHQARLLMPDNGAHTAALPLPSAYNSRHSQAIPLISSLCYRSTPATRSLLLTITTAHCAFANRLAPRAPISTSHTPRLSLAGSPKEEAIMQLTRTRAQGSAWRLSLCKVYTSHAQGETSRATPFA